MMYWLWTATAAVLVFLIVYRWLSRGVPRNESDDVARPSAPSAPPRSSAPPAPSAPSSANEQARGAQPLPKLDFAEDADVEPTLVGTNAASTPPPATRIVYDEDAATEEPTAPHALILVTATGQSDKGVRRRRNEDSILVLNDHNLFVIADGMGGYHGGEIASTLAVTTIEKAFTTSTFAGPAHDASMPRRASELARAIQMANEAIRTRAKGDKQLDGMGTTICAARFSANKQRLYVGHVGDSRIYRLRDGKLQQMTTDHTMRDFGVTGEGAEHLSRAVGIWPTVPIDIILGKPRAGDVYLLCSDGLTKMVPDDEIAAVLRSGPPQEAVSELIREANGHGGKDNITVVVVRVEEPTSSSEAA